MQGHGWTSETFCWVKAARYKRIHILRFHLYKVLEQGKLISSYRNHNLVLHVGREDCLEKCETSPRWNGKILHCSEQLLHRCTHVSQILDLDIRIVHFVVWKTKSYFILFFLKQLTNLESIISFRCIVQYVIFKNPTFNNPKVKQWDKTGIEL